jgi:hypothetical protein
LALGISVACSASASAASFAYDYTFAGSVNGDAFTANVVVDETNGNAVRGTGTISGAGLTGTQDLTLVTLLSPGVENDGGGLFGYRSNDGTDVSGADTVVPIDSNGLIFAMGPAPGPTVGFGTSQQFDVSTGCSGFCADLFGSASSVAPAFFDENIPVTESLTITAVPEPATWAMLLLGVGMVGAGLRMARRKGDFAPSAA